MIIIRKIKVIKLFLNKTDDFLSNSVKRIFDKVENKYKNKKLSVDISRELKKFEVNPLTCILTCDTKFETNIKFEVKIMLGFFFVAIPLFGFTTVTYLFNLEYSYAFLLTFLIAVLATSRTDEIAKRYVTARLIHI